jgi:hypothetical protein
VWVIAVPIVVAVVLVTIAAILLGCTMRYYRIRRKGRRPLNGIEVVWGESSVSWFGKKNKVDVENLFDVTKMNPMFDEGDPDSDDPEQPEGEGIQNLVFEETDMDQLISGEAEESEYSTDSSASSDNEEEGEESDEEKEESSESESEESVTSAEESEDEGDDDDTVRLMKVASRIKQWENCVYDDDPSSEKECMQTTSEPVKNNPPTAMDQENTEMEPEEQDVAETGEVNQATTEVEQEGHDAAETGEVNQETTEVEKEGQDVAETGKVNASFSGDDRPSLLAKKLFIRDDPPPTKDIPRNPRGKLSSLISNWESRIAKGGPSSGDDTKPLVMDSDRHDDSDFLV